MAALGEANDSVEKREKSQGDERAGRWIGVSATTWQLCGLTRRVSE